MVPAQIHLSTVQYLDLLTASEAASHLPACQPHPYLRHTHTLTHCTAFLHAAFSPLRSALYSENIEQTNFSPVAVGA